jgi:amidase
VLRRGSSRIITPMSLADALALSALDQAQAIRRGDLGSEELARGYLERIARANPRLTAFVTVFERRAIRAAQAKDDEAVRARRSGRQGELAPFHGVAIGVKDLNFVRGSRPRFGSAGSRMPLSPMDDKTTAQLRRGGFVVLGKLATSEVGAMPVTEPDIHPATRNPWDLEHTSGGSSGGSGSAVAAGLLPIAQGSDGAGSIRIPSSFCHLFGLKPSRGRVANAFGMRDQSILYTDGPMARSVADAAALLDVMAGETVGKRSWAPPPPRRFAELAEEAPKRLRIRVARATSFAPIDPEIAATLEVVAQALRGLGHDVEEGANVEADLHEFLPLWQYMIATMPLMDWRRVQPITRWLYEAGRHLRGRDVNTIQRDLELRVERWFGAGVDLWVSPTVPRLPPRVGEFRVAEGGDPAEAFGRAAVLGAFTAPFNICGYPAASYPAAVSKGGLPIGIQLAGRAYADATVLAVARSLEQVLPHAGRRAEFERALG